MDTTSRWDWDRNKFDAHTHTQPPLDDSRDARWKRNTPLNFHMDRNNLTLCEAGKVLRPRLHDLLLLMLLYQLLVVVTVTVNYCYYYCCCCCCCCCRCCCCCCRCCCSSSFAKNVTDVTHNSLISSAKVMGCSIPGSSSHAVVVESEGS